MADRGGGMRTAGRAGLVVLLLLLAHAGGVTLAAAGEAAGSSASEVRALESEVRLASKDRIYFVLDARDGALRLKAAGLTLKEMPITRWSFWGGPIAPTARALVRKSTLFEPKRPTITPEAAEAPSDAPAAPAAPSTGTELNALELKDMPVRFRLLLDQGIRIVVRPEPAGLFSLGWEWIYLAGWYLTRPFPTVWNALRSQPYTALYLRIAAQDARALYWASREGAEFLVILP